MTLQDCIFIRRAFVSATGNIRVLTTVNRAVYCCQRIGRLLSTGLLTVVNHPMFFLRKKNSLYSNT